MANFSISGKLTVGGATTLSSLTASRVLITDASKNIAVSAVTSTELGYLDGVTSNIQSQINSKSSVGKDTNGMSWNKDDVSYTGRSGAEIFNDYTNNIASGDRSHAEGYFTIASGSYGSHAEGSGTEASANGSHAEGSSTEASGDYSHAEGQSTTASGDRSHAEGQFTTASNNNSHAEGQRTTASGESSHAEGEFSKATGIRSHAEGYLTTASANGSHAEGSNTEASANGSHAEGTDTEASGDYSHAEGDSTKASATAAHSEGTGTLASSANQHVQGQYNVEDTAGTYVHIVGWGTGSSARKNIHTIDTSGNAVFAGKVTVQNTTPTAAGDLTTKSYVDSKASDTKVTNTLNNTVQAYVTGTTSASTNTGTQVFDSGVYLTTESGTLHVSKIEVGGSALSFDNDLQMLSISFA